MGDLLKVKDLKTYFFTDKGIIKSVDGVSFNIREGETLCVVGESGCGKSITAMSILKLIAKPGKIVDGYIEYKGKNLIQLSDAQIRSIRGKEISMIFQEPMTSLNPVFRIGEQISEILLLHEKISKQNARKKSIDMLKLVGIPRAEKVVI